MIGLRFAEQMAGWWRPLDGDATPPPLPARLLRVTLVARADRLARLLRDGEAALEGTVEAEGLARCAPARGTLFLSPLRQRALLYRLAFAADDGASLELRGRKDLDPRHPLFTASHMACSLVDARGDETATAELAFDLRRLPALLGSFRLV